MAQIEKENVQVVNLGFKEQNARKLWSLGMAHENSLIGPWEDPCVVGVEAHVPSINGVGAQFAGVCCYDRGISISLDLSAYST